MVYTALACSYQVGFQMHFNCKATPTNDTDYSCHKKLQNLFNHSYGSISHHITPLFITSLGGKHTQNKIHRHTHTHILCGYDQIPETKCAGLWLVHTQFKFIASVVCLVGMTKDCEQNLVVFVQHFLICYELQLLK